MDTQLEKSIIKKIPHKLIRNVNNKYENILGPIFTYNNYLNYHLNEEELNYLVQNSELNQIFDGFPLVSIALKNRFKEKLNFDFNYLIEHSDLSIPDYYNQFLPINYALISYSKNPFDLSFKSWNSLLNAAGDKDSIILKAIKIMPDSSPFWQSFISQVSNERSYLFLSAVNYQKITPAISLLKTIIDKNQEITLSIFVNFCNQKLNKVLLKK